MRRGAIILALGFVGAVVGYYCLYLLGTATPRAWLHSRQPELAWLKHEFSLSASEFARVSQLHVGYLPQCKERCRRIEELNNKLMKAIAATTQMTSEIEKLLAERARMRAECQAEMLKHFFEVSRTMPPDQGKRYLAWVQEQTCIHERMMNHAEAGETNHHE
jgi:hypothetical protein